MNYSLEYACLSHVGRRRTVNQDNFICAGRFIGSPDEKIDYPVSGALEVDDEPVFGVFDGLGGEECGEIASLIAARCASEFSAGGDAEAKAAEFCKEANDAICRYASENKVSSMGTTAAMLVFTKKKIVLCNIGDSRIYRFADKKAEQISYDHIGIAAYGVKPPLLQNLGIPPEDMVIDPFISTGTYHPGDVYLICSDGLTDMVPPDEIEEIVENSEIKEAAGKLLEKALENGGKDNITLILIEIEKSRSSDGVLSRIKELIGGKKA